MTSAGRVRCRLWRTAPRGQAGRNMERRISCVAALSLLLLVCSSECGALPAWLGAVEELAAPHAAGLPARDARPQHSQQLLPLRPVSQHSQQLPSAAVEQPIAGADGASATRPPPSLASVALAYGVSPTQLRQLAATDADLRVTPQGLLVWACGGHQQQQHAQQAQQSSAGAGSTQPWAVDSSSAFALHSRPGAKLTIQLEFRGCTITDTAWNAATNTSLLSTAPFDIDGDAASFGELEQQRIATIWRAVAEDFAPWAVDVTTEDVGEQAVIRCVREVALAQLVARTQHLLMTCPSLRCRSDDRDDAYGMRVCVGGSSAVIGGDLGGLAFTGAWGQLGQALQPVLVFPA